MEFQSRCLWMKPRRGAARMARGPDAGADGARCSGPARWEHWAHPRRLPGGHWEACPGPLGHRRVWHSQRPQGEALVSRVTMSRR